MELLNLYLIIGVGVYCTRVASTHRNCMAGLIAAVVSLVIIAIWPWVLFATWGEKRSWEKLRGEELVRTAMHFKNMEN